MHATPLLGKPAPELAGATHWIGNATSLASLRGKVALVEIWTHGCGNCVRSVPFVQRWQDKYAEKGLAVVGVHAPEFEHEKDPERVRVAMRRLGITFPVALDNDFAIWNAYANRYWPTAYLVDREGRVIDAFVGEGRYAEREARIRRALGLA